MINKLRKSKLFKNSVIYTVSSIIEKMIPFLMMPILTKYLEPSEYGSLAMFNMIITIVIPFIGLSTHGAMYRKYFDLSTDEFKVYIFNLFIILAMTFLTILSVLYIFSDFIVSVSGFTLVIINWIYVVSFVALSAFINTLVLTVWQLQHKAIRYGIFQILKTLLYTFCVLFFVVYLKLSWEWAVVSTLISTILFSIIALGFLIKENMLKISFNIIYIKNALSFGVPMLPTSLKDTVMSTTDRLFLVNMISLAVVGFYTIAFQLSMIISLMASSFNSAFSPWLFEKLKLNNHFTLRKIVKYTYLYFILISIFGIFWIYIATLIIQYFLDEKYIMAIEYIPWVVFSFVFSGMHKMVVNYIYYAEKTKLYAIVSIIVLVLNIILNYVLIINNGAIGVAQATCISSFLMFIFTWYLSSKVYEMPWRFWRV